MNSIRDKYGNIKVGVGIKVAPKDNNGSIAIGSFCESIGRNSIAIGGSCGSVPDSTKATGDFSIAIGSAITAGTQNGLGEIKIGSEIYNQYYYDGGSGWKVGSDIRDKISIKPINECLQFITNIEPISFRYNYRRSYSKNNSLLSYDAKEHEQATKAEKTFNYGVSAQEVASILKDIYGTEYYGNIISKKTEAGLSKIEDYYTINLTNFIPFLIGAIKEQQQQIDELKKALGESKCPEKQ